MVMETTIRQQTMLIGLIILMFIIAIYFMFRLLKFFFVKNSDISFVNKERNQKNQSNKNNNEDFCHNKNNNEDFYLHKNNNKYITRKYNNEKYENKNFIMPNSQLYNKVEYNNTNDKGNIASNIKNVDTSKNIKDCKLEDDSQFDLIYDSKCFVPLNAQNNIKDKISKFFKYNDELTKTDNTITLQHNTSVDAVKDVKECILQEKIILPDGNENKESSRKKV